MAADARAALRFAREVPRHDSIASETATQALKCGLAALTAWAIAAHLLQLPMPYLAPWAALVMVRTTVYWSVVSGVRQVTSVGLGVVLAYVIAVATPGKEVALAVAVPIAVLLGKWRRLDDQGLYVPFTALFIITAGSIEDTFLLGRLAETGLGALIGTAVNLLIFPPVRVRTVRDAACKAGDRAQQVLRDIARGMRSEPDEQVSREWVDSATRLDDSVAEARLALERGQESLRFNPRPTITGDATSVEHLHVAAVRLDRVASAIQAVANPLHGVSRSDLPYESLDGGFSEHYTYFLDAAAEALGQRLEAWLQGDDEGDEETDSRLTELLDAAEHDAGPLHDQSPLAAELKGALLVAARRLVRDLSA
ncbi:FUSC family protein [Glycomyces tarimensis]